ncbi:MAG: class II aldolase/adducin family protein [Armatimonadetes bacterium]|nr:class II aldolase/adducin family protein [Armatimonadota bacterium]
MRSSLSAKWRLRLEHPYPAPALPAIIQSVQSEDHLRDSMCATSRRLASLGLIGACEGNLAVRLGTDRLLCTPSGRRKAELTPEDLVVIDLQGQSLDGRGPSSEIRIHLASYRHREDCCATIHAHPTVATALTLVGETIPDDLLPEAACVLGRVASVPFGFPGTEELADSLVPFLADHKTFLLSHHGALVLGRNLDDACDRMETLERVSKVVMYAIAMGRCEPMPRRAFDVLSQTALNGGLS